MPELPEVETTKTALAARIHLPATLMSITIRNPSLRVPVPDELHTMNSQPVRGFHRQAKYIIVDLESGSLLIHLGMSGRLLVVDEQQAASATDKHTHAILEFTHQINTNPHHAKTSHVLFRDPRRFGMLGWQPRGQTHNSLIHLGVEPLSEDWHSECLYAACRKRTVAIKHLIMQQSIVVGIGNIYAAETLFRAGVRPFVQAQCINKRRAELIVQHSKDVLREAIAAGGTSLKDFYSPNNTQGYFAQQLFVYGRAGAPCLVCNTPIVRVVRGARSAFYCPTCQRH